MAKKASAGSFRKGDPRCGRPPGVPNRTTVEIREAAQAIVEDPIGRQRLLDDYRRGRLAPAIVIELHHYAYGKPKDTLELTGSIDPLRIIITDGSAE